MPETVCVTVEQLREIEWKRGMSQRWCPCCENSSGSGHKPHCWLGSAIAQAERLKDWKPKVGDRVRLKAMPGFGPYIVRFVDTNCGGTAWLYDPALHACGSIGGRFFAELMPEE